MIEEETAVEKIWKSCNRERLILAKLIGQKGAHVTHDDVENINFAYPPDTDFQRLKDLLTSAEKIAAQYTQGFKGKWQVSRGRVLACARTVVDLGAQAAENNATYITIHHPSGTTEKLSPDYANARILGHLLYALENNMVPRDELRLVVDKNIDYWNDLLNADPDLAQEGIVATMMHYPDDPLHARVKNARLKGAGSVVQGADAELDPVVEIASKALSFATKIMEHLKSNDYSAKGTMLRLHLFKTELLLLFLKSQEQISEEENAAQVIQVPERQSFLGVKTITPKEAQVLMDVYGSLNETYINLVEKSSATN
jgi:hypothetical protein